ncbi:alpha-E domain-containing protein [Filomicrobium sp.]|uniref:alpha-E domain-containing protein n=1 Tax=Filomicrobium sp. TaxID=2024831 RepID=UPI002586B297|nr:alpha-E domain-containing protein [Filomicrobium sp.]MCV0369838.1 alpha-E domain-containing protein [Filomicrobium sp.]
MSLLARYAEHLFWMARYMERADSLARIIETHAAYDRGRESETSWKWLVQLYADDEEFEEKYTDASQRNVLHFYIRDLDHPGSILSAIKAARENARALRAYLPTEMWSQLNEFYNRIMLTGEAEIDIVHLSRTCGMIKSGCQAQFGVADSTLYRDEGWRFYGLGQFLERADQTSRLLDVKFAQLAAEESPQDRIADTTFWALVLRSASAYQAFQRIEACRVDPDRIAVFLLLNPSHPRSVSFCTHQMERLLHELRMRCRLARTGRALHHLDELTAYLQVAQQHADLVGNLHAFNDGLQRRLNAIADELGATFFGYAPHQPIVQTPEPGMPVIGNVTQSQSQSQGSAPS